MPELDLHVHIATIRVQHIIYRLRCLIFQSERILPRVPTRSFAIFFTLSCWRCSLIEHGNQCVCMIHTTRTPAKSNTSEKYQHEKYQHKKDYEKDQQAERGQWWVHKYLPSSNTSGVTVVETGNDERHRNHPKHPNHPKQRQNNNAVSAKTESILDPAFKFRKYYSRAAEQVDSKQNNGGRRGGQYH